MRKADDIRKTITEELLCGDSSVYFEHGFQYPKLGTRKIIAVTTKQVVFLAGAKALTRLKRDELLMVENELKKYFEHIKQNV